MLYRVHEKSRDDVKILIGASNIDVHPTCHVISWKVKKNFFYLTILYIEYLTSFLIVRFYTTLQQFEFPNLFFTKWKDMKKHTVTNGTFYEVRNI